MKCKLLCRPKTDGELGNGSEDLFFILKIRILIPAAIQFLLCRAFGPLLGHTMLLKADYM